MDQARAGLPADPFHGGWQEPVLERRAITQGAGLSRENRNIMPGIVDCFLPSEGPPFGDGGPILADDDAIGVSMDFDRAADSVRLDRVFVATKRTSQWNSGRFRADDLARYMQIPANFL
jgi:hypothetical protein